MNPEEETIAGSSPRILLLLPHFLPGSRYGGPVRTVANLLERLGDEYDFRVFTSDHDFRSSTRYDLPSDCWLDWQGQGQVRYASRAQRGWRALASMGRELAPDLIYLNSFFHPRFSLLPVQLWRVGAFGNAALVLAPRGEFAPGALAQKSWKKRLFLALARRLGGYGSVLWQASSEFEEQDIRRVLGSSARIHVAPNLGRLPVAGSTRRRIKQPGELRLLFVGRLSPMKNLPFLLRILAEVPGHMSLKVAGPSEETGHEELCHALAAALPGNVHVEFLGAMDPEALPDLLDNADLLVQPSLGENFGHSILEALCHGLPVLISNRTPWRGLEARRAGWDLSLEDPGVFRHALEQALAWSETERQTWSAGASTLGRDCSVAEKPLRLQRELFRRAMDERRTGGRP
jgi:glycosyltransferase involved in cell wall biosynthesis